MGVSFASGNITHEVFINPDVRTLGLIRINPIVYGWNDKMLAKEMAQNTFIINYSSLGSAS